MFSNVFERLWVSGKEGVEVQIIPVSGVDKEEQPVAFETSHGGLFEEKFTLSYLPKRLKITAGTETQNVIIGGITGDSCIYRQHGERNGNQFAAVSDVDDTMLETGSGGNILTLGGNLVLGRYPKVNGVPEVYARLQPRVDFFYVSSSPTRFYTSIKSSLDTYNYPIAPLYLNHYHDDGLTIEWEQKMRRLEDIVLAMPRSQFFLFGDNTSHDLSAYMALAQWYPNRINTIYIRVIPTERFSFAALKDIWERNLPDMELETVPDGSERLVKTVDVFFWTNVVEMENDCIAKMNTTTPSRGYRYLRFHFRSTFTTAIIE